MIIARGLYTKEHNVRDGSTGEDANNQRCCIYYWDERDGKNLSGWWVAPVVGAEQVWAHCPHNTNVPPGSGTSVYIFIQSIM